MHCYAEVSSLPTKGAATRTLRTEVDAAHGDTHNQDSQPDMALPLAIASQYTSDQPLDT